MYKTILHKAVNETAEKNVDKDGKFFLKGVIKTVRWNEPAPGGSGGKKLSPDVCVSVNDHNRLFLFPS